MQKISSITLGALSLSVLFACSQGASPEDGGAQDAGPLDLGAAPPADLGAQDSGPPDLGADSGTPDLGTPDLGPEDLGGLGPVNVDVEAPARMLSEYAFFTWQNGQLDYNEGVVPYTLNAPLFSDFALKARALWIPAGSEINYRAPEAFDLLAA